MTAVRGEKDEREGVLYAAKLMLVSARTAPKSGGVDDILSMMVFGEKKEQLADEMDKIAEERKSDGFKRDAKNVRDSEAVVLIGVRGTHLSGLDCGGCGYPSCDEFQKAEKRVGRDFVGPTCIFKLLDLGIALGSAVKTASILNVDNRVMYRAGAAAKRLNMLSEASVIMGIPVSAKGKNIYFDRSRTVKAGSG